MKTMIALAVFALATGPAVSKVPQTGAWQIGQDSYHIYYADPDRRSAQGCAAT